MRLTIVAVGKLKETWFRDAAAEYLKRLEPYATVSVIEVPDRDVSRDEATALAEEGAAILKVIPPSAHVIALDIAGTSRDSVGFARHLEALALGGRSSVVFVIGGAAGMSGAVLDRADERMSLGPMTIPHQLARVLLLEQLYRAFKISRNEPYHR